MDAIFLVPYAYDRIKSHPIGGTTKRINAVISAVTKDFMSPAGSVAVLTAGYTKANPTEPSGTVTMSLAEEQAFYIKKIGSRVECVVSPSGWGTIDETRFAISEIKKRMQVHTLPNVVVYVSSNSMHLHGRVWLCWMFMKPKAWKVVYVSAPHSFSMKEALVQEPVKMFDYLVRLILKRY